MTATATLINEDRLFQNLRYFFKNSAKVFEELVENSLRAKANNIWIDYKEKDNRLIYVDDGQGIKDYYALLCIGDSNYDPDIVASQNPAGMGFMQLLAMSEHVTVHSRGAKLEIECDKFFQSKRYRDKLLEIISRFTLNSENGVKLEIIPKNGFHQIWDDFQYLIRQNTFSFYRVKMIVNGKEVKRLKVASYASKEIDGLKVHFLASNVNGMCSQKGGVLWFGKFISSSELYPFTVEVWNKTDIYHPKLPDRGALADSKEHLRSMKRKYEKAFAKEIQEYLQKDYYLTILQHLEENYRDSIERWKDINNNSSFSKSDVLSGIVIPVDPENSEVYINGKKEERELNLSDDRMDYDGLVSPYPMIGNTTCPEWAKPKKVKVEIEGYNARLSTDILNFVYTKAEKISVNGVEKDYVVLEDWDYGTEIIFSNWNSYPYPNWGEYVGDYEEKDYELDQLIKELIMDSQNRFDPGEIRRFLLRNNIEPNKVKQIVIEDLDQSVMTVCLEDGTVKKINH